MIRQIIFLLTLTILLASPIRADQAMHAAALAQVLPTNGLLHGVYPGGKTGEEDDITPADLDAYETAAGGRVHWVFFSNNWYRNRNFPLKTATWIRSRGATPYVRLMLRSDDEQDHAEPLFTLQAIYDGKFDNDLRNWAQTAARFKTPIIAEFGTEMNGEWFSWNAKWNGRQNGAALFQNAYRHIIEISREAGADNVIWVFHVNNSDHPETSWNRLEKYYPGDDYIDWLAISTYSMLGPFEDYPTDFRASIDTVMARLQRLAPNKPVIVAEFGTDVRNRHENAAQWADKALRDLISNRWPSIIGFSWWNETWQSDDNPDHDTDMRVQSDAALAAVFRKYLAR